MEDWIGELLLLQRRIRSRAFAGDPVERLVQEHRIISDIASTLEIWALRVEAGYEPNRECLEVLVSFLVEFVDQVHHEKEECVLIPRLVAAGLLGEGEAALDDEHGVERYLVEELSKLAVDGGPLGGGHVASLARELSEFQKHHLEVESRGIYAALARLDPEQRRGLRDELLAFDQRTEAVLSAWRAKLRWLLDRRGVRRPPRPQRPPTSSVNAGGGALEE